MKNCKFALVCTVLVAACAPNLNAMLAVVTEVVPAKQETKEVKAPLHVETDSKASTPLFDLETINKRLATIAINRGFFSIEAEHPKRTSFFVIPRKLKLVFTQGATKKTIGQRQYDINESKNIVEARHVKIDKGYQRWKLGTLLILAALHDNEIVKHGCTKITVTTITQASANLYIKLGFKDKGEGSFELDDIQNFLTIKTGKLLEEVFTRLEEVAKEYARIA